MTPRPLDWRSVERKLTRIRRLVDQLIALGPFDRVRLDADTVATLAAERILTLLVDFAFATNGHVTVAVLKQAPDSYRESFLLAAEAGLIDRALARDLAPSAGMRNAPRARLPRRRLRQGRPRAGGGSRPLRRVRPAGRAVVRASGGGRRRMTRDRIGPAVGPFDVLLDDERT